VTRDGHVWVNGIPLEQTAIWRKEKIEGAANLVEILRQHGLSAVSLPLNVVRGDLRATLSQLIADKKVQAIVCDAEEDADLASITQASVKLPVYWVGSAGLAAHLTGAAMLQGRTAIEEVHVNGSIFTVVGSLSAVSREQARVLEQATNIAVHNVAPSVLRAGESGSRWQKLQDALIASVRQNQDVLIMTELDQSSELAQGHALCEALGRVLVPLKNQIGALVATGGETARALLLACDAQALNMVREIEPGVPMSLSIGEREIPVITKAGAFGTSNTLLRCYQTLAELRNNPTRST
jgi:4-hydroxythreonine-4-phosphate dehydrogenase